MQAQLRVGSMLQVPLIQTVEQAFQDIKEWLRLIAGGQNVPVVPGTTGANQHLGFRYERDSRSQIIPNVGEAVLLADDVNDLEKQVQDCRNGLRWLESLCDRTLSVQCDRSFEHAQWALHTTQLLIKIRSLLEQALVRFLAKCLVWAKGVPAAFPACSKGFPAKMLLLPAFPAFFIGFPAKMLLLPAFPAFYRFRTEWCHGPQHLF